MQLSDKEKEEIERLVDAAFLKLTGRTWREPPGDSLGKIARDFPSLFGTTEQ
jgi:hypothetical protein